MVWLASFLASCLRSDLTLLSYIHVECNNKNGRNRKNDSILSKQLPCIYSFIVDIKLCQVEKLVLYRFEFRIGVWKFFEIDHGYFGERVVKRRMQQFRAMSQILRECAISAILSHLIMWFQIQDMSIKKFQIRVFQVFVSIIYSFLLFRNL